MDMVFIVIIAGIVLAIFVSGYINEQRAKKAWIEQLISDYGNANSRKYTADELKSVRGYHLFLNSQIEIDDITWNDLDMWSVYKQVNYCKSSAGDEYLYHILKCPSVDEKEWDVFEKRILDLVSNEKDRIELQVKLSDMGRTGKYSLFEYLNSIDSIGDYSNISDLLLDALYILAAVLCFAFPLAGVISLVLLVSVNVATYFKKRNQIEPYIVCFEYIFRVLKNAKLIADGKYESITNESHELDLLLKNFGDFKRFSSLVIKNEGNGPLGILLDYVRMFTHADLIRFKGMYKEIMQHKPEIVNIIEIIGCIDCYISIGEYRAFLKNYCIPELSNETAGLNICDVYHPLINNPVANSLNTVNGIVLTGSNASGKSTFLKTVSLNIILAQSIHTVCASEYAAPYYRLFTSLNLKDSIKSGDSYYMAEIKAIKRIIDASQSNSHRVVAFVDEVLRGTNTTERIAASSTILNNMKERGILVFAATHDLELTTILSSVFDNYHFEELMNENDVVFPYKISAGKAISRNAIKLLGVLGFENNITNEAQQMVDNYEKKGVWSL